MPEIVGSLLRRKSAGAYGRLVACAWWPLFGLQLNAPTLILQPMREADLDTIAGLLPEDVEQDPAATRYDVGDPRLSRGIISHQSYWAAWGAWRPEAWRLPFVVTADGQVIGVQELEGTDFPRLRTVDSSSFLIPSARGRGWGKQMRRAVLALAFGPLGAQAAITSAWHDNHASLGVSRALGYNPNGETFHPRGDHADLMIHMRLRRAGWVAARGADDITVSGFDACRPLFGLAAR